MLRRMLLAACCIFVFSSTEALSFQPVVMQESVAQKGSLPHAF
jgi:hypothetical protein